MFSISIMFPVSEGFVSVAGLLEFGCVCSLTESESGVWFLLAFGLV